MFDSHQASAEFPPPLTQFDFHPRIAQMTGVTLVMFGSTGCGSCRHLRPVLQAVAGLQPDWGIYEVDAGHEQALVNEFEVFHLPTIFLFRDGHFHCQLGAEARPLAIIQATRAALQQPAAEAP